MNLFISVYLASLLLVSDAKQFGLNFDDVSKNQNFKSFYQNNAVNAAQHHKSFRGLGKKPPGTVKGVKLTELVNIWWHWAKCTNAFYLETCAPQTELVPDNIYFLAGAVPVGARECFEVPKDSNIFFPIVNLYCNGFETDSPSNSRSCNGDPEFERAEECATSTADFIDYETAFMTVDGESAGTTLRIASKESFYIAPDCLDPKNQKDDYCQIQAEDYDTNWTDGLWGLLPPLTPGTHKVRLFGQVPIVDVEFTLHVV